MKLLVRLWLLVFFTGLGQVGYGQFRNYGKEAEAHWNAGLWYDAAEAYKKAFSKMKAKTPDARQKKGQFSYRSAESYRHIRYFGDAEIAYEKAIKLKYFKIVPEVYFYLGEMQMAQGKHLKAVDNFKKYKQLNTNNPLTDIRIESCESYTGFLEKSERYILNAMHKINSTKFDYGAVVDSRGTTMYFSSTRPGATGEEVDGSDGEDYSDVFVTKIDRKGNMSEPVPVEGGINTIHSEGAICLDGRGKKMFFTRCIVSEKNVGCDIYVAEKKSNSFGSPVKIELKDHDSTNAGQPCVSPDGNTLIFASDMAGGEGGIDLWMTTTTDEQKTWGLPQNMGPEINTAGDDMFPTWGPDNSLYYASNGMVGAGGLDIYIAQRIGEKNEWKNPVNMGAPINTYSDDYHMIFTQNDEYGIKGYLSSNRPGSKGKRSNPTQDIWSFQLPPVIICCTVTVVDHETREPLPNVKVNINGSDGSNYIMTTNEDGLIKLCQKEDDSYYITPENSYSFEIPDNEGKWLGNRDMLSTHDITRSTNFIREISVINIEEGEVLRLPEIRYNFDSDELQVNAEVNSKDSLNYLYDLMVQHPNIIVQLIANTDSRGDADYNKELSQRRAEKCVEYLVNEKGLPKDRLVPFGQGEDVPTSIILDKNGEYQVQVLDEPYINKFKSDEAKFEDLHQKNRRTEVKVISFEYK